MITSYLQLTVLKEFYNMHSMGQFISYTFSCYFTKCYISIMAQKYVSYQMANSDAIINDYNRMLVIMIMPLMLVFMMSIN